MHADDDIALEPDLLGGHRFNLLTQDGRAFEEAHDICERDRSLRTRSGQQQDVTDLTRRKLVLRDGGDVHADRRSNPGLATPSAGHAPKRGNPLTGRRTLTSNLTEDGTVLIRHLQPERCSQYCQPPGPRCSVAKRRPEQILVEQRSIDADERFHAAPSPWLKIAAGSVSEARSDGPPQ